MNTLGGDAVVFDGEGDYLAGLGGLGERDGDFAVSVGVLDRVAAGGDLGNGHSDGAAPAIGGGGGQVEEECGDAVFGEEDFVGGLAGEFIGFIGEGEMKNVILGVDAVLARPGVGLGAGGQ